MKVYVLNKQGKPLMPCKPVIARLLLKDGKAKCIRKTPFTVKLLVSTTEYKQEVIAGMDTGSKFIGCAAIANGKVVYQSEIQVRQDVSKKMKRRKMYRINRRGRKTRYRKPRWQNRSSMRKEGRLAPSIKSKVDSHLREKNFVESILPVSKWHVETASFDIHKISRFDVKEVDYQKGDQKGFYNMKAYVLHRDGYQCQKCKTKKGKLHIHHIVFRSNGGTNTSNNLATLCEKCHKDLHAGKFEIRGIKSKTKHATEIGVVKSQLNKMWDFIETFGFETKFKREQILQLPKTHYNDAIAICCEEGEFVDLSLIVYFKKHVAKGDYQQTKGIRSEKRIPTGKLFGLRKFDYIQTSKGTGFVKGKRTDGRFAICDVFWNTINGQVQIKNNCVRLNARTTTLIERKVVHYPTGQAAVVSCT